MAIVISYVEELLDLRDGFGLSEGELAGALDTTPRTLRRWLAGANPLPESRARIEDLLQLLSDLRGSVQTDVIPKWVRRRVDLLDFRRPADLFRRGELGPLFELADSLASGSFV